MVFNGIDDSSIAEAPKAEAPKEEPRLTQADQPAETTKGVESAFRLLLSQLRNTLGNDFIDSVEERLGD